MAYPNEKENLPSIIQDHYITERRSKYTAMMNKCYYRLMEKFEARYQAIKDQVSPNLFGEHDRFTLGPLLNYDITNSEFGIDKEHAYTVKRALRAIMGEPFVISGSMKGNAAVELIAPISYVKYDPDKEVFNIQLSELIVNHYLELNVYDRYSPLIARSFDGQYTPRFYEWACRWRKQGFYDIDYDTIRTEFWLNAYTDDKGKKHKAKYRDNGAIMRKIIIPSLDEIRQSFQNGTCDFWLRLEEKSDNPQAGKRGRPSKPTRFRCWMEFEEANAVELNDNGTPKQGYLFPDEAAINKTLDDIQRWLITCTARGNTLDKKLPEKILNQVRVRAFNTINPEPDLPRQVLVKLQDIYYRQQKKPDARWGEVVMIIKTALREDFRIVV